MLSFLISVVLFIISLSVKALALSIKTAKVTLNVSSKVFKKGRNGAKNGAGIISKAKNKVSSLAKRLNPKSKSQDSSNGRNIVKTTGNMAKNTVKLLLKSLKVLIVFLRVCSLVFLAICFIVTLLMSFFILFLIGGSAVAVMMIVNEPGGDGLIRNNRTQVAGGYVSDYYGSHSQDGSHVVETPITGDNSSWISSCQTMWNWYCNNVSTYAHVKNLGSHYPSSGLNDTGNIGKGRYYGCSGLLECNSQNCSYAGSARVLFNANSWGSVANATCYRHSLKCSLLQGGVVYDDCSAFVCACLKYYGAMGTSSNYGSGSFVGSKPLSIKGFMRYPIMSDYKPVVGDIIAKNGHVEIIARVDGNNVYSWTWGAVPDGAVSIGTSPIGSPEFMGNWYTYQNESNYTHYYRLTN